MIMGYVESLILSFAVGWFNSYLYRKYLRKRNKDWIVFLACIFLTIIWTIDILIYFDIIDIRFLNFLPWVKIISKYPGRYYLWNSFLLFGLDFKISYQPGMEIISAFLFASYLFWYYLGSKIGKVIQGYYSYQGGYYMIFRPVKKYIKDRENRLKQLENDVKP
jgi:hypothetical protein